MNSRCAVRILPYKLSKLLAIPTPWLPKPMFGTRKMSEARSHALEIFHTAVNSVLPQTMVGRALKISGDDLLVNGMTYRLDRNVHIVAFGKAVAGMVRATEDVIGEHVVDGIASVPAGIVQSLHDRQRSDLLPTESSKVRLLEGAANNLPDEAAEKTASLIAELAASLTKDDLLITLISGGGSALLPSPLPPVMLKDVAHATLTLSKGGATIQELNLMRKHLEQLKGGGLARLAYPAKVLSLILSDVIGDPLDMIASGPTVRDTSTTDMCLQLLDKMELRSRMPPSVLSAFSTNSMASIDDQTDVFAAVNNVLIGSNRIALDAAREKAEHLGYLPFVISCELSGDVHQMALLYHNLANFVVLSLERKHRSFDLRPQLELELLKFGVSKDTMNELRAAVELSANKQRPLCILGGGEATVTVTGSGLGGRNQQMALLVASHLHRQNVDESCYILDEFDVQFLSAGTDGQDGPTDAAGAYANADDIRVAYANGIKPEEYLENNDSHGFFEKVNDGESLIKTGFTGTNVMDVQVLLVDKKLPELGD